MKQFGTLAVCFMLLNTSVSVSGQAVIPDAAFGNAGKVILSPGTLHDVANAVAIQSDQKIVFTGVARITPSAGFATDLVVGRLNSNGSPEPPLGSTESTAWPRLPVLL